MLALSLHRLSLPLFFCSPNYLIIPYSLSYPLWTPEPVLFVFVSVLPKPDLLRPTTLLAQLLYTTILSCLMISPYRLFAYNSEMGRRPLLKQRSRRVSRLKGCLSERWLGVVMLVLFDWLGLQVVLRSSWLFFLVFALVAFTCSRYLNLHTCTAISYAFLRSHHPNTT